MSNAATTAIPAQPRAGEAKAAASQTQAAPDFNAVKAKMKAAWMDGDYAKFATYMEPGARKILAGWNGSATAVTVPSSGCGAAPRRCRRCCRRVGCSA